MPRSWSISDDGTGFDLDLLHTGYDPFESGFGLFSIREQLNLTAVRSKSIPAPGRGSAVTIVMPLAGRLNREGGVVLKHRIFIADDHRIVREGLQSLVEKENDLEVVGMADNGRQAVTLTRRLKPDVVIMDIAMPELNGIDATRQIVDEVRGVKVIALSMHSEKQFVEGMLRAGVAGYLLKESAFEELIKAIRIVCAGKKY